MKNYKNLLKIGSAVIGVGLLALTYNFFNTYTIVGQCPTSVDTQPCQAYNNWTMLNEIGLIVLVIGGVILVAGLAKRHQDKS